MPDRSSKYPRNAKLFAQDIVDITTTEREDQRSAHHEQSKNPAAVALGKLGGKKGGVARAKKLTAEQRSEIARLAATARWSKHDR